MVADIKSEFPGRLPLESTIFTSQGQKQKFFSYFFSKK